MKIIKNWNYSSEICDSLCHVPHSRHNPGIPKCDFWHDLGHGKHSLFPTELHNWTYLMFAVIHGLKTTISPGLHVLFVKVCLMLLSPLFLMKNGKLITKVMLLVKNIINWFFRLTWQAWARRSGSYADDNMMEHLLHLLQSLEQSQKSHDYLLLSHVCTTEDILATGGKASASLSHMQSGIRLSLTPPKTNCLHGWNNTLHENKLYIKSH